MARILDAVALEHALATARLDIPSSRHEAVIGAAGLVFGLVDKLDSVELGDTQPATAFNTRWV